MPTQLMLLLVLGLAAGCDSPASRALVTDAAAGTGAPSANDASAQGSGATALEPGINPLGVTGPEAFVRLEPGADAHVEFGFQGFYMIVLALRTDAPAVEPVWVEASFQLDGEVAASSRAKMPKLIPEPDGRRYVYDIFVITPDPEGMLDRLCDLHMKLEDDDGRLIAEGATTVTVRAASGGP